MVHTLQFAIISLNHKQNNSHLEIVILIKQDLKRNQFPFQQKMKRKLKENALLKKIKINN